MRNRPTCRVCSASASGSCLSRPCRDAVEGGAGALGMCRACAVWMRDPLQHYRLLEGEHDFLQEVQRQSVHRPAGSEHAVVLTGVKV